jgi:N-acetylglucosamine-6-phosphate deacetylase
MIASMIALTASRLYTPSDCLEQPLVLIDGDTIVEMTSRTLREVPEGAQTIDFPGGVLAPGFVDIHIHGAAGHDVMKDDSAGLARMERLLAQHGVGSYFPTTVTAPLDQICSALERLAGVIEHAEQVRDDSRSQPLGIHLEGPFISHARRGVHPEANLLRPSFEMWNRFWQASNGRILMITVAPELEGALEVIAEAAHRGVCVSLGHSDAGLDSARAGISAGARHCTHAFNAMRPLDHRQPGIIGAMLTDSRLSADIIADGIHVDPSIVKLLLAAKGHDSSVLITDATAATGMPDGRYRLGLFEVEVKAGRCMADGKLAGSVLTMDRAVRNIMQFAGWNLQQAVQLASLNPARVAGLTARGKLEPACKADIVVLTPAGEVQATMLRGALVENSGAKARVSG